MNTEGADGSTPNGVARRMVAAFLVLNYIDNGFVARRRGGVSGPVPSESSVRSPRHPSENELGVPNQGKSLGEHEFHTSDDQHHGQQSLDHCVIESLRAEVRSGRAANDRRACERDGNRRKRPRRAHVAG